MREFLAYGVAPAPQLEAVSLTQQLSIHKANFED
jgi:hypothetical protein